MQRLRISLGGLIVLLAGLFSLGWIDVRMTGAAGAPLPLVLGVAVVACAVVLVPSLARLPTSVLAGLSVLAVGTTTLWLVDAGSFWPEIDPWLTAAEVSVAGLVVVLAHRIAAGLAEFEDAVANVTLGDECGVRTLDVAGDDIAVEMARARRHERPLTVTVMSFDAQAVRPTLHRLVRDIQERMIRRYVMSTLARLAAQETRRGDIVVQDPLRNRVIIVSPEASPGQLTALIDRLRSAAWEGLGLPVAAASAGFPHHALTFDELVTHASSLTGVEDAATDHLIGIYSFDRHAPHPADVVTASGIVPVHALAELHRSPDARSELLASPLPEATVPVPGD